MEAGGSNMHPRPPLCARNIRTLLYHQLYEDGANSGSSLGGNNATINSKHYSR